MSDPRYTLIMILRDNQRFEPEMAMAVGVDHEVKNSVRAIYEMKAGFGSFQSTVELIRAKEFRKDLFLQVASQLGARLAERMEDAEGWHDASRIEPARAELAGRKPR